MEEPSVLDYFIDKITFWKKSELFIPDGDESSAEIEKPRESSREQRFAWGGLTVLVPILLGFVGQRLLEPPFRSGSAGAVFYLAGGVFLLWMVVRRLWKIQAVNPRQVEDQTLQVRWGWLAAGGVFSGMAYLLFLGNRFTVVNTPLWLLGLGMIWYAFWVPESRLDQVKRAWEKFFSRGIQISPWLLAVLAVFGLSAFYRFYLLSEVPPEMFSDHAEKLLDVSNLLRGQYLVFFPRNTGREAVQMYLTAAVSRLFGTGISFESLKIGTGLAGLFTLPFVYLLGKEIADREVGVLAMFFAGIAYWPNVISRVALRFTLYPFFTAPVLYFLIRGLRRKRWNDFLFAGLALGLGLHGYSTFRIVPFLVVLIVAVYLLHVKSREERRKAVGALLVIALVSLIVFLPLLRYAGQNYDWFSYRMLTRLTGVEKPLEASPWVIFFSNLWKSLIMFQWDNGEIWVHSIPGRPALGVVSAVFFSLGVILVMYRYWRDQRWEDLVVLISIPVLLLPSALSLAFPEENPSLNRSGGALIPVFVIVSTAVISFYRNLKHRWRGRWGTAAASAGLVLMLIISSVQNFRLVFEDYYRQFQRSAWNTSEIGGVIRQFSETIGNHNSAWVIPYPHWVDTRLVGIHAQDQVVDYALARDQIQATVPVAPPKLFIYKPNDLETENLLRETYTRGVSTQFDSRVDGRDFMLFYVLE